MAEKKVCLINPEHGKVQARGLCFKCWQKWRRGDIPHPIIGEWKAANEDYPKAKDKDVQSGSLVENKKRVESDLLVEMRIRLKEAGRIADTLVILKIAEQAKKEIKLFAQKYE